jgi:parallel beta-helix repeat protein
MPSDGTDGSPITYVNASGDTPIVSGANDITAGVWADQGGNVWRYAIGATTVRIVVFNTTQRGTVDATPDSNYEWTYSNPNLDVYAESDPNGYYSLIEAGQRNRGFSLNTDDWIVIDGITFKHGNHNDVGILHLDTSDNVTIQNCTSELYYGKGIEVDSSVNPIIDGNTVSGGDKGITIEVDSTNPTITDNTISSVPGSSVGTSGKCIDASYTSGIFSFDGGGLIARNTINNCGGYGIDVAFTDGIVIIEKNLITNAGQTTADTSGIGVLDTNDDYVIVRYNRVSLTNLSGGAVNAIGINIDTDADNARVYGNIVFDNDGPGILIWQATGALVYNNTLDNNGVDANSNRRANMGVGGVGANGTFKNNISASTNLYHWHVDGDADNANVKSDYNLYDSDAGTKFYWTAGAVNFTDWKSNSGEDANSPATTDPFFTNAGSDDFTLAPNSPAINAGVDLGATYDDALNPSSTWPSSVVTRIQNASWDLGAYGGYVTGGGGLGAYSDNMTMGF